ncbi:MAG: hypothetical protein INQ03_25105 [Candidatus Heimdallarchaeota archaeon]|nr:hypothetical protein [Candidatus Heimdallarchaeota archaeon]
MKWYLLLGIIIIMVLLYDYLSSRTIKKDQINFEVLQDTIHGKSKTDGKASFYNNMQGKKL